MRGTKIKLKFKDQVQFRNYLQIMKKKKVRAAKKIKNKYLRKKVGQRKHVNKISAEWLKTAGYLDTADQDKINYIFVPS